ncbi:hypothetical protein [Nocardia bovistercoris]|uniref:Uncharacterized protein n=1 Tax=Nocardia bovistercoris TaxID=2785916 RepID=A0A931IG95_9NOCA|nr:hypothetical protein [Nocardia bovistercoris]MBH0780999.1 hypothetical protein [Nocardia bovistercoris]
MRGHHLLHSEITVARIESRVGELLGDRAYRDVAERSRREIRFQSVPAELVSTLAEIAGEDISVRL